MVRARHGRRAEVPGVSPDAGELPGEDRTTFHLALNAPDDAEVRVPTQLVANEYATRYLETIGVKPSRATLDLVHRNVPLTESCIKTTLRSEGHVSDGVLITAPSVAHAVKVPTVITPHSVAQLGLNNQVRAEEDAAAKGSPGAGDGTGGPHKGLPAPDVPGSAFRRLAARFLHPFNLETNMSRTTMEKLREMTARPGAVKDSMAESLRNAMRIELGQELAVNDGVVLTVLAPLEAALVDWYKAQAQETLKGRLELPEFQATMDFLCSQPTVELIATALNFMHDEFIVTCSSYRPAAPASQRGSPSRGGTAGTVGSGTSAGTRAASPSAGWKAVKAAAAGIQLGASVNATSMSGPSGTTWAGKRANARDVAANAAAAECISRGTSPSGRASAVGHARGIALQQFDLGYRMFVDERLADAKAREKQPRDGGSRRGGGAAGDGRCATGTGTGMAATATTSAAPASGVDALHAQLAAALADGGGGGSAACSSAGGSPRRAARGPLQQRRSPYRARGVAHAADAEPAPTAPLWLPMAQGDGGAACGGDASAAGPAGLATGVGFLESSSTLLPATSAAVRRSVAHLQSASALETSTRMRGIRESLSPEDMDAVQRNRLYAMQKEFAVTFKSFRQERSGMFFVLPIFLLVLRLTVSIFFSTLYPIWAKTQEGLDTMDKMDASLLHLFDPNGYLQRNLSLIQASSAAVNVISRYPHKSHEVEHAHFSDTSPLMRAALGEPTSSDARRMLAASAASPGGTKAAATPPYSTRLSKAQQAALYADVNAVVATPNTCLVRVSEPAQPTTRDSWIPKPT